MRRCLVEILCIYVCLLSDFSLGFQRLGPQFVAREIECVLGPHGTLDVKILDEFDEGPDSIARALPGPHGFFLTDFSRKQVKRNVDLVLDHRGAVEAAATHRLTSVDHHDAAASVAQLLCHQCAADAASDDQDVAGLCRQVLEMPH